MEHASVVETRRKAKQKQAETNAVLKRQAGKNPRDFRNQKHVDVMSFNAGAEAAFVELVRGLIEEAPGKTQVPLSEVMREASYELNVSTMTVKRYLTKMSARRAPLRVFGDAVMLNPNYRAVDVFDAGEADDE